MSDQEKSELNQLADDVLQLCYAIERLPASTEATDAVLKASSLHRRLLLIIGTHS